MMTVAVADDPGGRSRCSETADDCLNAVREELERQDTEAPSVEFLLRAALRHATYLAVSFRMKRDERAALRYAGAAEVLARRYERVTGHKFEWHTILPH